MACSAISAALSWPVAYYIVGQRNRFASLATPLDVASQTALSAYFAPIDLEQTRIHESPELTLAEPPFSQLLRRFGFRFPSVSLVAAITLGQVIAAREPLHSTLLFHELVHVVQYRLLGIRPFAYYYVRGFLAGGSYEDIPLERCAFELEHRFACERNAFSVEAEVAGWMEQGRF